MTTESTMIAGRAGEPVADPDLIAGTRRRALLRIERHPCGPRLYCAGLRVHHGAAGIAAILTGAALRRRAIVAAGVIALADDWQDFPFNDRCNH